MKRVSLFVASGSHPKKASVILLNHLLVSFKYPLMKITNENNKFKIVSCLN